MTQNEIIGLANLAGFTTSKTEPLFREMLEAFAKLVAAKEREACASLVDREWSTNQEKAFCYELSAYIRARGEA